MKRGADISEYQGLINYDRLILTVDFIYIRASIGLLPDKYIDRNIQECERVGLQHGFYHAYDWTIPIAAQIEAHYGILQGVDEHYPRALDLEKYKGTQQPRAVLVAWREAFRDSILYCNPSFIKRYLTDPSLTDTPLWLANWGTNYPVTAWPWSPVPFMWQYAVVPGAGYGCRPNPINIPKIDLDVILEV